MFVEDITTMVLCKPKLLPLKSLTLEKLEKMHQAAQNTIHQQEMAEKDQRQITHWITEHFREQPTLSTI